jgi:ribonuclease HI
LLADQSISFLEELNDFSYDALERALLGAAQGSIPVSKPPSEGSKPRQSVAWWTTECSNIIKERNKCRNKYSRTRTYNDFIKYKAKQAESKLIVKNAKISFWHSKCSDFNKPDRRKMWQTVTAMKGMTRARRPPLLLDPETGFITNSNADSAKLLATHFSHANSDQLHDPSFIAHKREVEADFQHEVSPSDECLYNSKFTLAELYSAIRVKKDSSPGPDGLSYSLFKHLTPRSLKFILNCLNILWSEGVVPDQWRRSIIIPVIKKGKDSKHAASYRPISLTSCFCKIYETMVNKRLKWHMESSLLFNPHQSGFRAKRSTTDQISSIVDSISKCNAVGHFTKAVFLDITKAYDLIWRQGLLTKVKSLGISGPMYNFIQSFISNRECTVAVGDTQSDVFVPLNGLPQGSVISPTLFLIMMDVTRANLQTSSNLSIFADDIALWHSSSSCKFSSRVIQNALSNLNLWSLQWGFNFSAEKTKSITFSLRRIPSCPLSIGGRPIEEVSQVRFLGVTLDRKLNLNLYTQHIVNQCQAIVNLMRHIRGTCWGADQRTLRVIFLSHIVSYITYAAPALLTLSRASKSKLEAVYNRALKVMCRTPRNSNPQALQVLTGCPPVRLQLLSSSLKYFIRSKTFNTSSDSCRLSWHSVFKKTNRPLLQEVTADFFLNHSLPVSAQCTFSASPPWHSIQPVVYTGLSKLTNKSSPLLNKSLALEEIAKFSHRILAYTDGSKQGSSVGYGFTIPAYNISTSVRISDCTDVFTAEAKAIEACLMLLAQRQISPVTILSDSLSVLEAMQNTSSSTVISDIQVALNVAANSNVDVSFLWIPSHCGIQGNEAADALAKASLSSQSVQESVTYSLGHHYSSVCAYILQLWQGEWESSTHPLRADLPQVSFKHRVFHPIVPVNTILYSFALNCPPLKYYLSRFTSTVPVCSHCSLFNEDRHHFVFQCSAFTRARDALRSSLFSLGIPFNWRSLLFHPDGVLAFCRFISDSDRFIYCESQL